MCSVLGLILPVVSSSISSFGFRASVHHVRESLTSVGALPGSLVSCQNPSILGNPTLKGTIYGYLPKAWRNTRPGFSKS